jgi:hypothetical protein
MAEEIEYSYDAYAEYHMLKQEIISIFFSARKALIEYRRATRRKKNVLRRESDFIDSIEELYLSIQEKIPKIRDSKGKTFDELNGIKQYIEHPERKMEVGIAIRYFFRLQEFLNALGIIRIEKERLSKGKAWEQVEEED